MGYLIEFPGQEPATERPQVGYCAHCGVEVLWPQTGAWPESCPNGCVPLHVQSWKAQTFTTTVTDEGWKLS